MENMIRWKGGQQPQANDRQIAYELDIECALEDSREGDFKLKNSGERRQGVRVQMTWGQSTYTIFLRRNKEGENKKRSVGGVTFNGIVERLSGFSDPRARVSGTLKVSLNAKWPKYQESCLSKLFTEKAVWNDNVVTMEAHPLVISVDVTSLKNKAGTRTKIKLPQEQSRNITQPENCPYRDWPIAIVRQGRVEEPRRTYDLKTPTKKTESSAILFHSCNIEDESSAQSLHTLMN